MWRLVVEPRDWQRDALRRWRQQGGHGVAAVVTGGGKTIFALSCLLHARTTEPDLRTVILVPTVALLDQWYLSLLDEAQVPPDAIAVYSGENRPREPRAVNVMVLNTGRTKAPLVSEGVPSFLIVDECHRAASLSNSQALRGEHQFTLGLSATPDRDYDELFQDVVVPALGPVIYHYDYNQARADGVIAPFELINVSVPLNDDEQAAYDRLTRRIVPLLRRRDQGDEVDDQLHRLLRQRARVSTTAHVRLPAAARIVDRHRRERAIVFHEQIEAAEVLTALLRARGHRAVAYHSALGRSLRQDNLRLFRRGMADVLVTCRALDEGINVPNASLAVIAASTSSTRQRIQRLGRVLRPAPGKTGASIYTLYATETEADRLRTEAEQMEGAEGVRWMTIGKA